MDVSMKRLGRELSKCRRMLVKINAPGLPAAAGRSVYPTGISGELLEMVESESGYEQTDGEVSDVSSREGHADAGV